MIEQKTVKRQDSIKNILWALPFFDGKKRMRA